MIIKGNTVGTTTPRSNWNQNDPKKADYVIGKDAVDEAIKKAQETADSGKTTAENHGANKENPHGVTAAQAGARPADWTPTAEEVKARPDTWLPSLSDIGAQAQHRNTVVTIPVSGWSENSQTVTVAGLGKDDMIISTPSAESQELYIDHGVKLVEQGAGMLTFECEDVPREDLMIDVTIFPAGKYSGEGEAYWGDAVMFTEQTLDVEQKAQARENIGAAAEAVVAAMLQDVAALMGDMADLKYVAIDITKISNNAGTKEIGSTVAEVTVSWTLNKTPASQKLNGEVADVAARSKVLPGPFTTTTSFELTVTDERGGTDKASTAITFLRGVYYGALDADATINSAAINSLSKSLQSGITGTFNMTAASGQKLTFAAPVSYGEPTTFHSGGLDYTWTKVATFEHTNASGHKESYNVWQNDEIVVGTFSFTVKK